MAPLKISLERPLHWLGTVDAVLNAACASFTSSNLQGALHSLLRRLQRGSSKMPGTTSVVQHSMSLQGSHIELSAPGSSFASHDV